MARIQTHAILPGLVFVVVQLTLANGCLPMRQVPPQSPRPAGTLPSDGDAAPVSQPSHTMPAPPPPGPSPPTLQELRAEADQAWLQRDSRPALEHAIAAWEQICVRDPNDVAAATALARAYYLLGDGPMRADGENTALLAIYEKGLQAGERAMLAYPAFAARIRTGDKVEDVLGLIPPGGEAALYWYAANLGRFALAKGFTTTLFYKERLQAVMQRVLAMNESFYYGAPHRYLGAYYAKVPSFAGGDLNKAREHFEQAMRINSNFFATKVLYAEWYATRTEDRALFTRLLSEVRDGDVNLIPDCVPEQRIEQDKAKNLLAQLDDLF